MPSPKNNKQTKKPPLTPAQRIPQTPKGMHDVVPSMQPYWQRIRRIVEELAQFYNFHRIDTPLLESSKLFERGTGEETDIVQKEMYVLKTKGGDQLALRPEGTPSVMRAYAEHALGRLGQPQKLYYFGPMFRHESPQLGRYRQFSQVGFEIIGGASDPLYDAQSITIAQRLLEELKIKNIALKVNSIGCRVCRPLYKRQLQHYYRAHERKLCTNCARRVKTNPLRLLDCKEEDCVALKAKAPNILDKLCSACSTHLKTVLEYLDELAIPYVLAKDLVRGLDYYNRTVFEHFTEGKGAEFGALPAGGRYDYLMEMLGGRPTPATGFAAGIERIIAVMQAQELVLPSKHVKRIFVAHAGNLAKKKSMTIIEELRRAGIPIVEALSKESLKAQLKVANKEKLSIAIIIGQREVFEESVIIRDFRNGLQETYPSSKMVEEIKKRLRAE